MAKLNETKIPITDFLEAYRCQPCLYNSLLETYKNRVAREEAYQAIIRSLKIPQLTVLDIKLKIKSVRTVYSKELRILMRKKELNQCYEPKLFWFKRADSFLRSVSLSHYKRLKNKNSNGGSNNYDDSSSSNVAIIKKETPQKMALLNASTMEDTMRTEEDQTDTEDGGGGGDRLADSYATDIDMETGRVGSKTANVGTSNNASSQTPDDARCSTSSSKTELGIDDAADAAAAAICLMEQQHQQQQQQQQQQQHLQQQQAQQQQRKFKYMPYIQQQHQQQQQQRLSTPFPSPSQQALDMAPALTHSSSSGHCFGVVGTADADDLVMFGQSIASQLRAIPDQYSRSVAKLRIQQVLFEAETGQSSEAVSPHLQSF